MLYQPSGWRGRCLKKVLPFFAYLPEACSPFPIIEFDVEQGIKSIIERLFPKKNLNNAIFEGTPSIHQKQTIQVFDKNEILAYCKIAKNERVKVVLEREKSLLDLLHSKQIEHVPQCIYSGQYDYGNHYMLVMSTEKTIHSQVVHEWTAMHEAFLNDLQRKTSRTVAFEECDLQKSIALLTDRWKDLPRCINKKSLASAMQWVEARLKGTQIECALMHGDFTPWNTFMEQQHLFVFDWEYAYTTAPVGLDKYHFFTQTAFFERHVNADAVFLYADSPGGSWFHMEQLLYYLILIIGRFVGREPKNQVMASTSLMAYWNELLIKCLSRIISQNQKS